jgi:hypothetical protein
VTQNCFVSTLKICLQLIIFHKSIKIRTQFLELLQKSIRSGKTSSFTQKTRHDKGTLKSGRAEEVENLLRLKKTIHITVLTISTFSPRKPFSNGNLIRDKLHVHHSTKFISYGFNRPKNVDMSMLFHGIKITSLLNAYVGLGIVNIGRNLF